MGMFTTVIDLVMGVDAQIKTGHDEGETYRVGDKFKWSPRHSTPGEGIDGFYDGWGEEGNNCWVVVHEGIFKELFLKRPCPDGVGIDNWDYGFSELEKKYTFTSPDPSLWTEEEWLRHNERKEKHRKDWDKFEESISRFSDDEKTKARLGKIMGRFVDYSAMLRRVFIVETLSDGATPTYDKCPIQEEAP